MKKKVSDLEIISDNLCLNFINSADWHGSKQPVEYLETPEDLVLWGLHVGMLKKKQVETLLETVKLEPDKWAAFFKKMIHLRETLYRIFHSAIIEQPIEKQDLNRFNSYLSNTLKYARFAQTIEGLHMSFPEPEKGFTHLIHPIIKSALNLLTSTELNRVKQCADPLCGWFFIDTSKNKSRCWCSMKDCGNRAKARRFYQKKRLRIQNQDKN